MWCQIYNHIIHTHINDSLGDVKSYGLRKEGRMDWERYEVRMKHMTTLESHDFFLTYIIPIFIYDRNSFLDIRELSKLLRSILGYSLYK